MEAGRGSVVRLVVDSPVLQHMNSGLLPIARPIMSAARVAVRVMPLVWVFTMR